MSVVGRAGRPGRAEGRSAWVPRDEVVVVFGGSSGIGEAVARRMVARGSRVVIAGRDPDRLAAASDRLGGAVQTAAVDASDRDAVDAFFADGDLKLDHLVLSFSTGRAGGPFRDLSMEDLAAAVGGKLAAYLSVLQARFPGCAPMDRAPHRRGKRRVGASRDRGLAAVNGGLHAAVRPLTCDGRNATCSHGSTARQPRNAQRPPPGKPAEVRVSGGLRRVSGPRARRQKPPVIAAPGSEHATIKIRHLYAPRWSRHGRLRQRRPQPGAQRSRSSRAGPGHARHRDPGRLLVRQLIRASPTIRRRRPPTGRELTVHSDQLSDGLSPYALMSVGDGDLIKAVLLNAGVRRRGAAFTSSNGAPA